MADSRFPDLNESAERIYEEFGALAADRWLTICELLVYKMRDCKVRPQIVANEFDDTAAEIRKLRRPSNARQGR